MTSFLPPSAFAPAPDARHDAERRRVVLLTAATAGVGMTATAVPFVASFAPASVPGPWARAWPIRPRSAQQPAYAQTPQRSIRPEIFVAVGICTHLGCSPSAVPAGSGPPGVAVDWAGGFFAPATARRSTWPGGCFRTEARAHESGSAAAQILERHQAPDRRRAH